MTLSEGLANFVPVAKELRDVDANGFCPECHRVATAWGGQLERSRQAWREMLLTDEARIEELSYRFGTTIREIREILEAALGGEETPPEETKT